MMELTQKYLHSIIEYDEKTGIFVRKHDAHKPKSWNTKYTNKKTGWNHSNGYVQTCIDHKKYYLHRLAWFYMTGKWPTEIDHIDSDKKNNSFSNLRQVNHMQNCQNRGANGSIYNTLKGVRYCKRDKTWMASIRANKLTINLGSFKCPTAAHFAYCRAAKKYHGEFARTA